MERVPPQTVVEGLATKSAKIRALARAGYSRREIANYLGVIYQHVRNVLVQAGIEAGDRNDLVRSAKSASVGLQEPWPMQRLLASGFELIGRCELVEPDAFRYSNQSPAEPGVYVFSVNGAVVYIGLTRGALRTRLGHYVYGHEKQSTSYRVKALIVEALANERSVEVCVARPPQLTWNGLPVDGPAGLETALIKLIRPPWNQQGAS